MLWNKAAGGLRFANRPRLYNSAADLFDFWSAAASVILISTNL